MTEDQFLGDPATHGDREVSLKLLTGQGDTVPFRQTHDHTEGTTTRDDRRLVHRIGGRAVDRDNRMAALVIGGQLLLIIGHDHGFPLGTHHDLVLGILELGHTDDTLAATGSQQCGLVHQIGEIGTGEAGRTAGNGPWHHVSSERHLAHMDFKDLFTTGNIRVRHHNLTVETTGAEQRRVEYVWTVGSGNQDHALIGLETIHLDQQLVQGLLAFVIAAAETGTAMTTDRIDLVNEDDTGRVLLALLEHIADATGTDTDEHLDEVRTGNGEEWYIRFTSNRTGGQGLTGTGRADEQHALRNFAAKALEFLRVFQELDNLLQLALGLINPGHIVKGYPARFLGQHLGLGLAEAHGLAATGLHLTHNEQPDPDQEQHRKP